MSIDNKELANKLEEIREHGFEFTVSDGDDPVWVIDKILERLTNDKHRS